MASNGDPEDPSDDPDDYPGVEETQYANYGGTDSTAYSESYEHLPEPSQRRAWYQTPVGLISLGVVTAAMLALLVYAMIDFTTAERSRPTVTTVTSTATPQSPVTTESPVTTTPRPSTTTETFQPPVTTAAEPPAPRPTSTANPSVTTVTETAIERRFPRLPNRLNPPPLYEPLPG